MHKGGALETSLAVGFTFSILMAAPLLLPNPIMGDVVARAHLVEVSSSNLLFGFVLSVLLLHRPNRG
jgi:tetrahydromethanopterin S-methyltransferase subunit F